MKKYKKQYTRMATLAVRVDSNLLEDLDKLTRKDLTRSDLMRKALKRVVNEMS
tara:strand:- start:653 stop:811 length:159 start_codon:yes stop_codon:yes gene_type:complete